MKRITALAAALLLALSLLTGCAQIERAEEPLFPRKKIRPRRRRPPLSPPPFPFPIWQGSH